MGTTVARRLPALALLLVLASCGTRRGYTFTGHAGKRALCKAVPDGECRVRRERAAQAVRASAVVVHAFLGRTLKLCGQSADAAARRHYLAVGRPWIVRPSPLDEVFAYLPPPTFKFNPEVSRRLALGSTWRKLNEQGRRLRRNDTSLLELFLVPPVFGTSDRSYVRFYCLADRFDSHMADIYAYYIVWSSEGRVSLVADGPPKRDHKHVFRFR